MRRQSFNLPSHAHYLTFSCYRRQQHLTDDTVRRGLLDFWDQARHKGDFSIWAYVLMPEHVHILIHPNQGNYSISKLLRLMKEPFSHWLVNHWSANAPQDLQSISVQRGERHLHRFWQEGGGYDRNLFTWDAVQKAVTYIEHNPVRRGLVGGPLDWPWSSARSRAGQSDVALAVDIPQIALSESANVH
jgi:putative transposase